MSESSAAIAGWFVAMAGGLAGLIYLARMGWLSARWIHHTLVKLNDLTEKLLGVPPDEEGKGGRPGIFERMDQITDRLKVFDSRQQDIIVAQREFEARLHAVEMQLTNNGGGSLRDRVDHVSDRVEQVAVAVLPSSD